MRKKCCPVLNATIVVAQENFGDDDLWEQLGVFALSPFPADSLVDLDLNLNVSLNDDGSARG